MYITVMSVVQQSLHSHDRVEKAGSLESEASGFGFQFCKLLLLLPWLHYPTPLSLISLPVKYKLHREIVTIEDNIQKFPSTKAGTYSAFNNNIGYSIL